MAITSGVVVCATLLLFSCERGDEQQSGKAKRAKKGRRADHVVAVVGQREITYADFVEELESLEPHLRMRFSSVDRKVAFLHQIVRRELLAQEAERGGLANSPAVVARVKHALAEAYLKKLRHRLVKLDDITDAEVRRHFDAHAAEIAQPFEQVRDRIRNQLLKQRRSQAVAAHIQQLRKNAKIELFPDNAAAAYRRVTRNASKDPGASPLEAKAP